MALSALMRRAALRAAAAMRQVTALADVWWADVASYLGPEHRARLAALIGPGHPVLVTGDRDQGFRVDGAPLESARPDRERLVSLRIGMPAVMRRRLDVPRAAATELDATLPMNLETWTPFTADEVYACARSLPEDRSGPEPATIRIEIRCAARRAVDDQIEVLAQHGVPPDTLQMGDAAFACPLPTMRRRAVRRQRRLLAALGALALAQGSLLHVLVAGHQSERIAELQREQERLTRAVRQKAALDRKADQARAALRVLAGPFDARRSVSRALEILAKALPAGTRIGEIAFDRDRAEGTLTVTGPPDLDLAGVLAPSGLYRVREIAAGALLPDGQRPHSVTFALSGWIPNDGRPHR